MIRKTVYIQMQGKRSTHGRKLIIDLKVEGIYVKKPPASKPGITVELELGLDPRTLRTSVTGTRTKSNAAKSIT
jgi:hypothetical protein